MTFPKDNWGGGGGSYISRVPSCTLSAYFTHKIKGGEGEKVIARIGFEPTAYRSQVQRLHHTATPQIRASRDLRVGKTIAVTHFGQRPAVDA